MTLDPLFFNSLRQFSLSLHIIFYTVEGYALSIAAELGIKTVCKEEEIEAAIVKAQKRKANILKQERATNGQYYIEPFEIEDVWNHVNTCHMITELAFNREELTNQVRAEIEADLKSTSSPLIIRGEGKTGKTWLCGQIPSMMGEKALTVLRVCGLTCLSTSLPNMLRNITKQLHVHYRCDIIPRITHANYVDIAQLFLDILRQVSEAASEKPLVLVWDGFDKLASTSVELTDFLSQFIDAVPSNIALVVSLAAPQSEKSEFFMPYKARTTEVFRKEIGKQMSKLFFVDAL